MKKIHDTFITKKPSEKPKDSYGKEQFGKLANKGMMKRWGNMKNMGRGRT